MSRFCLLAAPRTGSSHLSALLRDHPDIKSAGEIFHGVDMVRKNSMSKLVDKFTKSIKEEVFEVSIFKEWLSTEVDFSKFETYLKSFDVLCNTLWPNKWCGFKFFYFHLSNYHQQALQYFKDNNYRVIHLYRRNTVSRYISEMFAKKQNKWGGYEYSLQEIGSDALIKDVEKYKLDLEYHRNFIGSMNHIEVSYEDLARDQLHVMENICKFLSVPYIKCNSEKKKQMKKPISCYVKNYRELINSIRRDKPELLSQIEVGM